MVEEGGELIVPDVFFFLRTTFIFSFKFFRSGKRFSSHNVKEKIIYYEIILFCKFLNASFFFYFQIIFFFFCKIPYVFFFHIRNWENFLNILMHRCLVLNTKFTSYKHLKFAVRCTFLLVQ